MTTTIVADSGSTKTRWAILTSEHAPEIINTPGINPVTMDSDNIISVIHNHLLPFISGKNINHIYFYGAGCGTEIICAHMAHILTQATQCRNATVSSDLLGAARSLCGHSAGIACILGTGSNSCLFNGTQIVEHVSPLGFILGDEGSGAVIGRILIGNILKRQLPEDILNAFDSRYHLSTADIIERVYRQPAPNAFLASFMPFVAAHISHPDIESMVVNEFSRFFQRNVSGYINAMSTPIYFTGSVAHHFSEQLHRAANRHHLHITDIIPDPLPGLISYHQ